MKRKRLLSWPTCHFLYSLNLLIYGLYTIRERGISYYNQIESLIMYYISKRMEIAGCHQLSLSYESKCQNLHGHNWVVVVYCKAKKLNKDGMVCDFKHIKDKIHGYLDHGNFNELLPFNPTAENIAKWVADQIPECYKASVRESEDNYAVYVKDGSDEEMEDEP